MAAIGEVADSGTIVDAPCGSGVAFRALRPGQRVRYLGFDLSPRMIEQARRYADQLGLHQVELAQGDAKSLPSALTFSSVASRHDLEWHERVREALDFKIANPNFFLWISVQAEPGASLDEQDLRRDVESWLGQLNADRVAQERDEPERTWRTTGLLVRLTAIPKRPEARATEGPIVGNPVPPSAYRSQVVNSEGRPVPSRAHPHGNQPRPS